MFRNKRKEKNTVPWSSGQDASLSRWNQGFDSPRHYQVKPIRTQSSSGPRSDLFFLWKASASYMKDAVG